MSALAGHPTRLIWAAKLLAVVAILFSAPPAYAAGFRLIEIPADANGPAIRGGMWSPCAEPPGQINLGYVTLPGVKDCAIAGNMLPLMVISHGRGGSFIGHRDTAETLADAGFVVAAISHPGDTGSDMSRTGELSVMIERPADLKRLIDFMLGKSPAATNIDGSRVGFFGFSRGGYTGLILVGANPDWENATARCQGSSMRICEQIRAKEYPSELTHDPRIKAAIIADPLTVLLGAASFDAVKVPIQLWASERGGDGVEPHAVATVDRSLPAKHEYRVVPSSGHFVFLTPCPPAVAKERPELCTDAPGFDRIAFHKALDAEILAFLRTQLGQARP